jgi:spore germination protein GerM
VTRGVPRALALALALLPACGRAPERGAPPAETTPAGAAATPGGVPEPEQGVAPLAKSSVTVWFPSSADATLVGESREIVDTKRAADRGTQILQALLDGPQGSEALAAVPEGTTLRQLWVRDDGTAYADFSTELARGMAGGSEDELLAVYSIVDSLTLNVAEIHRVGILVEGRERDTLSGHVDLRRPLPPDRKLAATRAKE